MSFLSPVSDTDLAMTNDVVNTSGLEFLGSQVRVIDGKLIETKVFKNPSHSSQQQTILVGPGDRIIQYNGKSYFGKNQLGKHFLEKKDLYSDLYSDESLYVNGMVDSYEGQKKTVRYYKYKILDYWLYRKLGHILKFMVADKSGGIRFVKTKDEYKNNNVKLDTREIIEKKANLLEETFLGDDDVKKLMLYVMERQGLNWWDFLNTAYEKDIVKVMGKKLHSKIKKVLNLKK